MSNEDGTPTEEEIEAAGAEGGEGSGEEEQELTPEQVKELIAERDELKARVNRNRTAAAREARARNRQGGDGGASSSGGSGEENPLQGELDAEKQKSAALEQRLNTEQATRIAAELGFKTPGNGAKLIAWDELVDPSDPDEVRDALREELKKAPELKRPAARADGGDGTGGEGAGAPKRSFNDIIRAAAGR